MNSVCSRAEALGFPIRTSPDRSLFASSPTLFAGYHVLHRLLPPRHPPYALIHLTIQPQGVSRSYLQLITHINANATFSREISKNKLSLENLASNQKRIFRIVKEQPGLMGQASQIAVLPPQNSVPQGAAGLVEPTGIEPVTSCLQSRRSPS